MGFCCRPAGRRSTGGGLFLSSSKYWPLHWWLRSCTFDPMPVAASMVIVFRHMAQDIVPSQPLASDYQRAGCWPVMNGCCLHCTVARVMVTWQSIWLAARLLGRSASLSDWCGGMHRYALQTDIQVPYGNDALTGSVVKRHGELRRATWRKASGIGFSAFWSTLAIMLHAAPFHLGSQAAGAFGLAGAAGALAAPVAGRVADRQGPEQVTKLCAGLVALSFAAMFFLPFLSPHAQLWLLGASAIGFDLGVQGTLIAHQTIIYSIDPGARSRLNAIMFVGLFIGMAAGSALGSLMQAAWGWMAVTALATIAAMGALATRLWPASRVTNRSALTAEEDKRNRQQTGKCAQVLAPVPMVWRWSRPSWRRNRRNWLQRRSGER